MSTHTIIPALSPPLPTRLCCLWMKLLLFQLMSLAHLTPTYVFLCPCPWIYPSRTSFLFQIFLFVYCCGSMDWHRACQLLDCRLAAFVCLPLLLLPPTLYLPSLLSLFETGVGQQWRNKIAHPTKELSWKKISVGVIGSRLTAVWH